MRFNPQLLPDLDRDEGYTRETRVANSCMNRLTCMNMFSASSGPSNLAGITGSRQAC